MTVVVAVVEPYLFFTLEVEMYDTVVFQFDALWNNWIVAELTVGELIPVYTTMSHSMVRNLSDSIKFASLTDWLTG
jgi:hypothetical protein